MSRWNKFRLENFNLGQIARSSLLVITSAALGGIAVAIWDRRTLADIRREPSEAPLPPGDEN